jgi:hypothetical protein
VGRREQSEFCRQFFLSRTTLDMIEDMRDQVSRPPPRRLPACATATTNATTTACGALVTVRPHRLRLLASDIPPSPLAQFRQLLSAIGFVPDRSGAHRHRRAPNVAAGPLGSAPAPPPPPPPLADGARVRAKYYGDGGWYAGVVLAQTGKGSYTVLFDGYEEDGPQVQ